MFGFLFGAACLVGMVSLLRPRHAACGPRGHHPGGPWGRWDHGDPGERPGGRRRGRGADFAYRAAGEVFKRKLRVDDDQEPIVDHALADLRTAVSELGAALKDTRSALAEAIRGERVDEATLAVAFAHADETIQRTRREIVSAVKQIHGVLDPDQRTAAADWLASGGPEWV